MNKSILAVIIAAAFAIAVPDANATKKTQCPDGSWVKHPATCTQPPAVGTPGWWSRVSNNQSQEQTQTAHGGNGTGVGVGIGQGGNSRATGGSVGDTTSRSNSSVGDVGNNSGNSTNDLTQRTNIGDVGSTSQVGNVGSNSGGNTLSNGSASTSGSTSSSGGNTMTGGANTASNAASADGSGNSNTNVNLDASDRSRTSYVSQTLLLPTIQTAAPALVANPALVVDRGACGPRMAKVQRDVNGTFIGLIFKSSIDLGVDDELVSAEEPYRYWTSPSGSQHVFGHQIVTYASVVGVAGSRAIGANGGETGGNYGGAGLSSGSSMQRTILRVQLQECEIQLQPREVPVLIEVERKRNNG